MVVKGNLASSLAHPSTCPPAIDGTNVVRSIAAISFDQATAGPSRTHRDSPTQTSSLGNTTQARMYAWRVRARKNRRERDDHVRYTFFPASERKTGSREGNTSKARPHPLGGRHRPGLSGQPSLSLADERARVLGAPLRGVELLGLEGGGGAGEDPLGHRPAELVAGRRERAQRRTMEERGARPRRVQALAAPHRSNLMHVVGGGERGRDCS